MEKAHSIFLTFLFLLTFCILTDCQESPNTIGFGPKLQCYQCNSFSSAECADFFDNRTVLMPNCPDDGKNYSRCRKIVQEAYYDGTWERRYIRDCAVTGEIGAEDGRWCIERLGTYRVKMKYCHCNNKKGCNSADFNAAPLSILLLGLCLLLQHIFRTYAVTDR